MHLEAFCDRAQRELFVRYYGRVQRVRRDSVRVFVPRVKVGAICVAETPSGKIPLEIVSLDPQGHVACLSTIWGRFSWAKGYRAGGVRDDIPSAKACSGQVVDSMCVPYEGQALSFMSECHFTVALSTRWIGA